MSYIPSGFVMTDKFHQALDRYASVGGDKRVYLYSYRPAPADLRIVFADYEAHGWRDAINHVNALTAARIPVPA